jgi:uncharacterized protein
MLLDLHDLLMSPGGAAAFDYSPDLSELLSDSMPEITGEPRVTGSVRYSAGLLTLTADVRADVRCVCARCLKEFAASLRERISVTLVRAEEGGQEDTGKYVICGDRVNIDDIAASELILNADSKFLCREDCRGLCPVCGKDLNCGPCACTRAADPRLAVLGRLLEQDAGG